MAKNFNFQQNMEVLDQLIYGDWDDYDTWDECELSQIGGICTEKNCKNCVKHSHFCPVGE